MSVKIWEVLESFVRKCSFNFSGPRERFLLLRKVGFVKNRNYRSIHVEGVLYMDCMVLNDGQEG
jgi:hypothetical protein